MKLSRLLAGALALALLAQAPLAAAVTANSVVTAQTPNESVQNFVQGTDAADTDKTLYTAGAAGSKCFAVIESNTDGTATHLFTVSVKHSSTDYQILATNTGLGDGTVNGALAKNLLVATYVPLPVDGDVNPFVILNSGDTLVGQYHSALTSATKISTTTVCADF